MRAEEGSSWKSEVELGRLCYAMEADYVCYEGSPQPAQLGLSLQTLQ